MSKMKATFVAWLPLAVVTTIICGLVYLAVQQDLRMTANDELVQISEDVSALLASGAPAQEILPPSNPIDISKSLAVYVVIYNASDTPVASTAELNGAVPVPPVGVFNGAATRGENRLTWQPAPGVRSAIVVNHYVGSATPVANSANPVAATPSAPTTGGYVLVGRSLREIENHESQAEAEAAGAWILCLALSFAAIYVTRRSTA
jgi:hypothetical protein